MSDGAVRWALTQVVAPVVAQVVRPGDPLRLVAVRSKRGRVDARFAFGDEGELHVGVDDHDPGDGGADAREALASGLTDAICRTDFAWGERVRPYVDAGPPRYDTDAPEPSAFEPGSVAWGLCDVAAPVLHHLLAPSDLVEAARVLPRLEQHDLYTLLELRLGDDGTVGYPGDVGFHLQQPGFDVTAVEARETLADQLAERLTESTFAWGERLRPYTDRGTPRYSVPPASTDVSPPRLI